MAARLGSAHGFVLALLGAVAAQWGFYAVAGVVTVPVRLGWTAAYGAVVAWVLAVGAAAPRLRPGAAIGGASAAGLVLTVMATGRIGASAPVPAGVVLVCLLAGGSLVGALVGGRVEKPGYLLVVAYVSSLADVFSVLTPGAPSAVVLESELLLSVLALPWPMLGARVFEPVLGVGDVVMSALYLGATRHLALGVARVAGALAVGYAACLAVLLGTEVALPALPFLGIAVLLFVPPARRLPREDQATAAMGMIALTLLFAALALRS